MKTYKKKLAGLVLSLVLIVGVLPRAVWSAPPETPEQFYYGCSQLKDENERKASITLAEGVAAGETMIQLKDCGLAEGRIKDILYRFRYDHPEFYDLEGTIRYSISGSDGIVHTIYVEYKEGTDDSAFRRESEKLLQLTWGKKTDYEKALVLHDALVRGVAYDLNAPQAHNAYGAIVDGRAVCEGYAKAYQYLLQQLGIQSFIATSSNHAWNLVRLDGNYYYTDVTWDDPIMHGVPEDRKPIRYKYFNIPESELGGDEAHTFLPEYAAIKPVADRTDMKYRGDAEEIKSCYDFAKVVSMDAGGMAVKLSSRLKQGETVAAAAYDEDGRMLCSGVSAAAGSGEVESVRIEGAGFDRAASVKLFVIGAGGVPVEVPLLAK